tara:strand:- start:42 stop:458 length:417 start_codon:yes stop_codon:yes gene_type:complete
MNCYYCGEKSDTLDHTIPVSFYSTRPTRKGMKSKYKDPVPVVDCCGECNATLNNKLIIDVRERADYLKEKYIKKYKRILNSPIWDEDDIENMGKTLRACIRRDMRLQQNIKERLDYLKMISNLSEDPFFEEKKTLGYA